MKRAPGVSGNPDATPQATATASVASRQPGRLSRRDVLRLAALAGLSGITPAHGKRTPLPLQRKIPRSGEALPVIGLGTWQTFDVGAGAGERAALRDVLRQFVRLGGSLLDSSPMYGRAETVAGDLAAELDIDRRLFLATKVWTSGGEAGMQQIEQSFLRLRRRQLDLLQVHNLVDWRTHLRTLRRLQDEGRLRYIGITHYSEAAHADLAQVMRSEAIDFVQCNYSLGERAAEHLLLPLAAERRIAVIVNRPFLEGRLFERVRAQALPAWASEIGCGSWAQYFLKFIVAHPAVTCVIPATSKLAHLLDNMQAGLEPLPDEQTRRRMAAHVGGL